MQPCGVEKFAVLSVWVLDTGESKSCYKTDHPHVIIHCNVDPLKTKLEFQGSRDPRV